MSGLATLLFDRTDLRARMTQGAAYGAGAALVNVMIRGRLMGAPHPVLLVAAVVGVSAVAGAGGGVIYFATEGARARGGWRKTLVNVVTLLGFCAAAALLIVVAAWLTSRG